jgi:TetR/AcrR family transcriptional regulator, regulator of biofilm formation and stress response
VIAARQPVTADEREQARQAWKAATVNRPAWHTPKGERRREQLLRAAMSVIGSRGYAGATQRSIAEAAGVPPAATHYFFDSLEHLIREAATRYLRERVAFYEAQLEAFKAGDFSPATGCRAVARLLSELSPESRSAQFEIYLNAPRQPELQESVRDAIARLEALAAQFLEAMAVPEPERWASAFLAVGDGFALRGVAGATVPADVLEHALLAIVVAGRLDEETRARLTETVTGT